MLSKQEIHLLKECLEAVKAEMEQLILDEEWYVSDVVDLVDSSLEVIYGHLGISPEPIEEDDYEEEREDY